MLDHGATMPTNTAMLLVLMKLTMQKGTHRGKHKKTHGQLT